MTGVLPAGLAAWVRLPGPAALLAAVRLRAQRGHRTEAGTLSGLVLTADQRREIGQLLGTGWELSGGPVRLQDLAARLAEHGLSVRTLVEAVAGGPIEENRAPRDQAAAAAAAERLRVAALLTGCGVDPLHAKTWLADPSLPRAGNGELVDLANQVATVWRALFRSGGPVRLARLAADLLHDAHALDASEPLGRAVARLAATVHGLDRPQRAGRSWREAWAAVGVRCDGVSSRVLTLNLPLRGSAPAARVCSVSSGEPVWLTLRSLIGSWTVKPTGSGAPVCFVCENPTVVEAAADAIGPRCPPLVCTDGIATGAALDLIAGLAAAGCLIMVRADVDAAGFTVVDQVRSVAPAAKPWRFDAGVYADALGLPQPDAEPTPSFDAALAKLRCAHRELGTPLHEERLLDSLLADLRDACLSDMFATSNQSVTFWDQPCNSGATLMPGILRTWQGGRVGKAIDLTWDAELTYGYTMAAFRDGRSSVVNTIRRNCYSL